MTGREKSIERLGIGLLLLLGAVIFFSGVVWLMGNWKFVREAGSAEGMVVGIELGKRRFKTNTTPVYPTMRFVDERGASHEAISRIAYSIPIHMGDQLRLFYNRGNPSNLMLEDSQVIWGRPLFVSIFGMVFLMCALLNLRRMRAARARAT